MNDLMNDPVEQRTIAGMIEHISPALLSVQVRTVLTKLGMHMPLDASELDLEITPSEVAAVWSVKNGARLTVNNVRQVKHEGRITPARTWGEGAGARVLYRLGDIIDEPVSNRKGRPKGSTNRIHTEDLSRHFTRAEVVEEVTKYWGDPTRLNGDIFTIVGVEVLVEVRPVTWMITYELQTPGQHYWRRLVVLLYEIEVDGEPMLRAVNREEVKE